MKAAATELSTEFKQYLPELEDYSRLLWQEWSDQNPKVTVLVMLDQIQQCWLVQCKSLTGPAM